MDQDDQTGDFLYGVGKFGLARVCFERALCRAPGNAALHFKIATCHWSEGSRDRAYRHLQAAIQIDPAMAAAHEWLGQWYLQEGIGDRARLHSAKSRVLAPDNPSILTSHAFVLEAAGEMEEAWGILQRLLVMAYTPSRVGLLYARLAPRHGRTTDALELARKLLSNATSPADQTGLHFVLAGLLDRMGEYDQAFTHAEQANRLQRPIWGPGRFEREVSRQIDYFTRQRLQRLATSTGAGEGVVFIVGLPRSGTSLVEQVLASHSMVYGGGELDFMPRVRTGTLSMLGATEADFPECLDRLTAEQARGLSEVYVEPLKAMGAGAARMADKMPLNFLNLGLIALLLPRARVIHCRRDPLDTCLSCFMTYFTAGNEFASDLTHLGVFHRGYERLMRHWKETLSLPIFDVFYESLVADPARQTRAMLEFLELPWEEGCLRSHETARFVTTASVEQVRLPIYQSSVGRWRHYEKHLGRLVDAVDSRQ